MWKTLTTGLLLVAASLSEAHAACNQASMAGTWTYTAINAENITTQGGEVRNGRSLLERCEFEIDGGGTIVDVSCDNENSEAEFQGVRFDISPNCVIQFQTIACGTGAGFYAGQLSRDQSVASGSALCGGAFDATGGGPNIARDSNFFNLVKR